MRCFPETLPTSPNGQATCRIYALLASGSSCSAAGESTVADDVASALANELDARYGAQDWLSGRVPCELAQASSPCVADPTVAWCLTQGPCFPTDAGSCAQQNLRLPVVLQRGPDRRGARALVRRRALARPRQRFAFFASAAELGLDDVALRTVESAGETLDHVSRAIVDVEA